MTAQLVVVCGPNARVRARVAKAVCTHFQDALDLSVFGSTRSHASVFDMDAFCRALVWVHFLALRLANDPRVHLKPVSHPLGRCDPEAYVDAAVKHNLTYQSGNFWADRSWFDQANYHSVDLDEVAPWLATVPAVQQFAAQFAARVAGCYRGQLLVLCTTFASLSGVPAFWLEDGAGGAPEGAIAYDCATMPPPQIARQIIRTIEASPWYEALKTDAT